MKAVSQGILALEFIHVFGPAPRHQIISSRCYSLEQDTAISPVRSSDRPIGSPPMATVLYVSRFRVDSRSFVVR
jgi:hypothetical protein